MDKRHNPVIKTFIPNNKYGQECRSNSHEVPTRPEDFELIKEENYKNYVVYFAAYKEANGNTNYGLPIFILIDKLGKARFAEPDETRELMRRWNSDEEEDED